MPRTLGLIMTALLVLPAAGRADPPATRVYTLDPPADIAALTTTGLFGSGLICGSVWLDGNEDKVRQAEELGLAGIQVEVLQEDKVIQRTSTDARGRYAFAGLPKGVYSVRALPPVDKYFTTCGDGVWPNQLSVSPLELHAGIDFGLNVPRISDDSGILPPKAIAD
ncbi:MAG: hypothetical protein K2V38_10055 [Gemmataceae bacterium]|nr:hypothetical protein [Gemmataceae bacterium]